MQRTTSFAQFPTRQFSTREVKIPQPDNTKSNGKQTRPESPKPRVATLKDLRDAGLEPQRPQIISESS